jgi:hypothetical protein
MTKNHPRSNNNHVQKSDFEKDVYNYFLKKGSVIDQTEDNDRNISNTNTSSFNKKIKNSTENSTEKRSNISLEDLWFKIKDHPLASILVSIITTITVIFLTILINENREIYRDQGIQDEKIENISDDVNKIEDDFDKIDNSINELDRSVIRIEKNLENLEKDE